MSFEFVISCSFIRRMIVSSAEGVNSLLLMFLISLAQVIDANSPRPAAPTQVF